jgi:hypothetical protein
MLGTLRYSDGLQVHIEGGWYAAGLPFSAGFEVVGKDAALTFQDGKLQLDLDGCKQPIDVPESPGYLEEMTYFVECCRKNVAPKICPPTDSAQAVALALLLRRSRDQNGKELECDL